MGLSTPAGRMSPFPCLAEPVGERIQPQLNSRLPELPEGQVQAAWERWAGAAGRAMGAASEVRISRLSGAGVACCRTARMESGRERELVMPILR